MWTLSLWALGVGFLQGFLHCAGMCGPFVMSYSLATSHAAGSASGVSSNDVGRQPRSFTRVWTTHVLHNLGRVATFTLLGTVFGALGSFVDALVHLHKVQAGACFLGGGLMIWWAIDEFRTHHAASVLERLSLLRLPGMRRWFGRFVGRSNPLSSLVSGSIVGLHPCGLLFAMLFSAAATGTAFGGGLILFAFGIGTTPSLLAIAAVGWYGRKRLRGLGFTYLTAGLIAMSGVLFVLRGLSSNGLVPKVNMWLF